MNLIQNLFNEKLISSLGWTLIHSLWQIALIGLLLKICLVLFKRKPGEFRYLLSVFSLASVVFLSVFTFTKIFITDGYYIVGSPEGEITLPGIEIQAVPYVTETFGANEKAINLVSSLFLLINSNLQVIVMLWLLGTVLFSLKFAGNFWYMKRLKKLQSYPAPASLIQIVSTISAKLNLQRKIQILESAIVKIPMVFGHLKPVILLPVGLAASLPIDQVEAILIHELAHIRRNDYLTNLLKSLMEVVFFYHPVFWWISSSLETEREHCCDDITISICGSEKSLQKALFSLQHYGHYQPALTTALLNNKYKLLNRIMRMKTTNQFKHGIKGSLAGFIIIVTGMIVLATSSAFAPKMTDLPEYYKTEQLGLLSDNLNYAPATDLRTSGGQLRTSGAYSLKQISSGFPPDTTIKTSGTSAATGSDKVIMEFDGNYNLISVKKDGKLLEEDEKKEYEAMAAKLKKLNEQEKQQVEQKAALEKAEKEFQAAQQQMEKAQQEYEKAISTYHEDFIYTDDSLNTQVFVWTDKTSSHPKALREIRIDRLPEIPDIPEVYALSFQEDELAGVIEKNIEKFDYYIDIQDDQLKELEKLSDPAKVIKIEKHLDGDFNSKKFVIKSIDSEDMLPVIRKELVKDGILKKKDEKMDFRLTHNSLEVNGEPLSADLHEKYLEIFLESTGNKEPGKFEFRIKD